MNDYLLKYKYIDPVQWQDIKGIIVEIDRNNFFYFIEDTKFEDYFVFFKDITCGEKLKKGDFVFFHVWDYYFGKTKNPGILGYFIVEKVEFLPSISAWKNDEKHSTFNNTKLFYKYFQQKYILRFQFNEIFYIPKEKIISGSRLISYKEILIKYFKLEDNLTEDLKGKIPIDKIGNTYLNNEIVKHFLNEINQVAVSRKIEDLPADNYKLEFDRIILDEVKNADKDELSKINEQRNNFIKRHIEKIDEDTNNYTDYLRRNIPEPDREATIKKIHNLELLRKSLEIKLIKTH